MGIMIEAESINVSASIEIKNQDNNIIGNLRSGIYSPNFKKVIGIAMIDKPYWKFSHKCQVLIADNIYEGKLCALPFI